MNFDSIQADLILAGGGSLNAEIKALLSSLNSIIDDNRFIVISDLAEIGMDKNSNTLIEICSVMPVGSIYVTQVSGSSPNAASLPLPTLSNGSIRQYSTGQLIMMKSPLDWNKVSIWYVGGNGVSAYAVYNADQTEVFSGWRFSQSAGLFARPKPAEFDFKMGNIWVSGDYFFTSDQVKEFTDRPAEAGAGYLNVVNSQGLPNSDRILTFTENTPAVKTWKRVSYSSLWISVPSMNPNAVADQDLRIGDMKINANGNLMIRVSKGLVKEL